MTDRTMVTPFFLERPVPQLADLAAPDWKINDPGFAGDGEQARLASTHRPLAAFVADTLAAGERPVSVAGDCCSTIAVMAGLQRAGIEPTLIWIDAHGDFNTWETTPSGFLGGMPLAMIAGLGELTMPEAVGLRPYPAAKITLADGRDLDPGEADLLDRSDVVQVREFADLLTMDLPGGPLYVHFDSDVIDAEETPAHNYPVPGGPSSKMVGEVFSRLCGTGRIVAASMSAWNPDLDTDGTTGTACMASFAKLLGEGWEI